MLKLLYISMSHLKIQRKRTESSRIKFHSEESKEYQARRSLGKIIQENIGKRRLATQNQLPSQPKILPGNQEYELEQAKKAYRAKNTKQALQLFKKIHNQNPNTAQLPYYIGSCLLNEGQYYEAFGFFQVCLSLDPTYERNVYIYMAICCKTFNKFQMAVEVLEQAINRFPHFEQAYFYMGKMYYRQNLYAQAATAFKKCLNINAKNELAHIQLADCLKSLNKNFEALERYKRAISLQGKHIMRASMKRLFLLFDIGELSEAKRELDALEQQKQQLLSDRIQFENDILYLRGQYQYEMGSLVDATVLLELSIINGRSTAIASRSIRLLMKIAIREKDFYGAEHLVTRCESLGIRANKNPKGSNLGQKSEIIELFCLLIEGINDIIKRKLIESEEKLCSVYEQTSKRNLLIGKNLCTGQQGQRDYRFLYGQVLPYYAYCLFLKQKYEQCASIYRLFLETIKPSSPLNIIQQYNYLICQGIIFHKNHQYLQAEQKFSLASRSLKKKSEPIFLNCINLIQRLKHESQDRVGAANKEDIFKKIEELQKYADENAPVNHLFLFYRSLILLHRNRSACSTIDQAIEKSDEEVSEYYFIQALAYCLEDQPLKGLSSLNKAIELDCNIPEFFKERSKYNYLLQKYEDCVEDILKIIQEDEENADEEAKLLLTFYYYMTDQYEYSLALLKQTSQQCSEEKFREFQIALLFRLGQYQQCGIVGAIMKGVGKKQLTPQELQQCALYITERRCYSQFTTYHIHLLMAAYYCYHCNYDQSLQQLFGALQQVQSSYENISNFHDGSFIEVMLNQIKFNIVIVNLLKKSEQAHGAEIARESLEEILKYMEIFLEETDEPNFKEQVAVLHRAVSDCLTNEDGREEKLYQVMLYEDRKKISDFFDDLHISLHLITIVHLVLFQKTKMVMTYPHKLKFNISPEFDDSFLFNFDIDKVEFKLCPPWFKLCDNTSKNEISAKNKGMVYFTDNVLCQSVLLSQTQQKCGTPLLMSSSLKGRDLKNKFKLDEAIEQKLKRIMNRNRSGAKIK